MKLNLEYPTQIITIELLENPIVTQWIDHLDLTKSWKSNYIIPSANYFDPAYPDKVKTSIALQEQWRCNLISSITNLNNNCNVVFPFNVQSTTQFSNNDLNTIHRLFTNAMRFKSWSVGGDKVIDTTSTTEFDYHLELVNTAVHELQNFCFHERKQETQHIDIIELSHDNYNLSTYFKHFSKDWKYIDYDLEYDVFMQYAICGKAFFQAYTDYDHCGHSDVTGAGCSYYNSFYIDINGKRNKFMKSSVFQNWLMAGDRHCSVWQYMPIGRVVSGNIVADNFYNLLDISLE
jgi:hypothetical protein